CASSRIHTLLPPRRLASPTRSLRSRTSSTELLEAASSSATSGCEPPCTNRHDSHTPHGRPAGSASSQLTAIASSLAVVVLPTPLGPEKRYACPVRPLVTAAANTS